ncbi:universal stress protein [Halomicrococcus gelatinilyticus]|uniref:universal stress protein n=1 Tax=Halomicrococcus gelatinilyticus TaxID=1702103 RepID=UPI002E1429A1
MYDRILIPTDGSDGSGAAVDSGFDLARQCDASVHLLYVVDDDVYGHYAGVDAIENAEPALEEQGERVLSAAAAEADGVDVTTEIVRGHPHEEILACADDVDADLVVMGTEQHTGEYRRLLGSVTERVVRMSDGPVHVVKA